MSNRAVVCVATTPAYQKGMRRLQVACEAARVETRLRFEFLPLVWPTHAQVPYAFKAFALQEAAEDNFDTLLWCDACMLPVQDMTPLWERIERDGYWFSRNGFTNYEWTADSAYPDLFPGCYADGYSNSDVITYTREMNRTIPHVVATCFGLSMRHGIGRQFLAEYYRLASKTKAFCGPWINTQPTEPLGEQATPARYGHCGPSDVRGHRHDQTAASVIAWRLGMKLTDPPNIFSYGKEGEQHDPRTIVIADGGY